MEFNHIPVLLNQCIENLNIKEDGIYVDGTLGGANHSREICKRLSSGGHLIGFDQDEEAIEASTKALGEYFNITTIVHRNFCFIREELSKLGIEKVDGILLDLGVSSHQIDDAERGFSYREDAPLDMRMDRRMEMTAADIVNSYSRDELERVIREYGEERYARKLATLICDRRKSKRIETTGELVEIIKEVIPKKQQLTQGHPAKRTFQAIRIELNHELDVLKDTIEDMADLLNPGGRLCIITFHSLEDRIVKQSFKKLENPCTCPPDFPVCVCGKKPVGKVITRKPIVADEDEIKMNSRSKSAKLRVFEHY